MRGVGVAKADRQGERPGRERHGAAKGGGGAGRVVGEGQRPTERHATAESETGGGGGQGERAGNGPGGVAERAVSVE